MVDKNESYQRFSNELLDAIDSSAINNYFAPVIKEILGKIPAPTKCCDVGCGTGVFSIDFKRDIKCELVGVDGSQYAVDRAKKLGFDETFLVEDFCHGTLPLEDENFDFVLCKDVLEHLLDPKHLVEEIARITMPEGYCLFHVPNHFTLRGRISLLFNGDIDTFGYFPNSETWNYPHIRFFTHSSLKSLCEESGLIYVSDHSGHFFQPSRLKFLNETMNRIFSLHFPDLTCEGITMLFLKK